jgi:hypothetical protein
MKRNQFLIEREENCSFFRYIYHFTYLAVKSCSEDLFEEENKKLKSSRNCSFDRQLHSFGFSF